MRKWGFWYPRLIPPYDLVSFSWVPKIRFYLPKACPWCFSDQNVSLFNFGDSLVPHIQRQDGNLTVDGFSWYTSGKSPARNFRAIINKLSNQFFSTFNSYIILEPVHWICLSLSLSHSPVHLQIQKPCPRTIFQTCKFPWTHFSFYFDLWNFLLKTS